jgi:hypothetical protein
MHEANVSSYALGAGGARVLCAPDAARLGCGHAHPGCMGSEQRGEMADLRATVREGRASVVRARRQHGRAVRASQLATASREAAALCSVASGSEHQAARIR